MKLRSEWKAVVVVGALTIPAALIAACSSTETTADAGPGGLTTCPATVVATNGAACQGTDLTCSFSVDCSPVGQTATCDCVDGKFKCIDRVGDLPANTPARCKPIESTNDASCPGSRANALGAGCTTAGLQCFYEGATCPENTTGKPYTDVCQCEPAPGDGGAFRFTCDIKRCASSSEPDPLPLDSGTPDATGASDASSDSSASPG